ncbi:MAG: AI-2E family transporter [Clostridia bacterium]|nr:AI-2E family transporter [Clostridia bacterium]
MKLDWKTCFRACISLFVLYLFVYYWEGVSNLLGSFVSALAPLLLGLVVAYVLNILMSFYEAYYFPKRREPWVAKSRTAVCLVAALVTLLAIIALVIGLVVPELVSCVKLLLNEVEPALEHLLRSQWAAQLVPADILQKLNALNWSEGLDKAVKVLIPGLGNAAGAVFNTVSSVISSTVNLFLGIIFAIYLLLDRDHLRRQGRRLLDGYLPASVNGKLTHCLRVLNECMHKFIVGQCAEALILGGLCILGMTVFRFPYAMMISTLIGFTALIPIAGAYIGAGVGAVMILTQSPVKALLFLLFIVVLQQLEGNLIYPKVVGNSIGLPALWVLAAITVGGSLMGITGMLLGVPLAAALYRLLREDLERRETQK